MEKLSLEQVGNNQWLFVWPKISEKATDIFYEALDYAESGKFTKVKELLNKALKIFPEHIDVLHHLSMLADNEKEATNLNEKAVNIGLSVFPKEFNEKSKLEWGWTENRPFLRAYHNRGLIALNNGNIEETIKLFNQIISWNPNDNQGARDILADIYVQNEKWNEMIDLSNKYPGDCDPSMNFGLALAFYKKGEKEKATKELKTAINRFPLCGKILLEKNPKKPKSVMPGYITYGGEDQAYEFWKEQGRFWQEEEIKKWLESVLDLKNK